MKTNIQNQDYSIHQQVEYFFRHKAFLTLVLSFMAIGLIKYETQLLGVLHQMYNEGFGLVGTYAHHDEITRMPISYGTNVKSTTTSGE